MAILIGLLFVALITLITMSLVVISLGWRAKADESTGEFVLRYSLPCRIYAVVGCFLVPIMVLVMTILEPPQQPDDIVASEIGLLAFKLLGLILLQMTFKSRILVSDEGLAVYSPWRRPRSIQWEEIVEVVNLCPKSWFVFNVRDQQPFHVPLYFEGLELLVDAIQRRLDPQVYSRAVKGFGAATDARGKPRG